MKRRYTLIILLFVFAGCINKAEVAKQKIDDSFNSELSAYLEKYASSIMFIEYSDPENYWYPEGTTPKEVLNDEFKLALQAMKKLRGRLNEVQAINPSVQDAIDSLNMAIDNQTAIIKKTRRELEQMNSIFGLGLYGGASGLYDFGKMLDGGKDEGEVKLPEELENHLQNVFSELMLSYRLVLLPKIHSLEVYAINGNELSINEKNEVRKYLEFKVKEDIKAHYRGEDTIARNDMIVQLLDTYNQEWPYDQ